MTLLRVYAFASRTIKHIVMKEITGGAGEIRTPDLWFRNRVFVHYLACSQYPAFSLILPLSPPFAGSACNSTCNELTHAVNLDTRYIVKPKYSTREAAKKLGRTILTLQRHIAAGTIEAPRMIEVGTVKVRLWSEHDIEKARKVLAGTKPGRKKKA
jgi:hypothetical protein